MDLELLEIQPGELKFTFELKKQSSCLIQLSNKTDQYVAFKVKTTSPKKYCVRPNVGIVKPKSACDFTVIMQAQRVAPPDLQCKDKFLILSTVVPFGTIDEDITSDMFSKYSGKYIEERKLKVVLISPPPSPTLLPLNGEFRKELHDDPWVQKDEMPNIPLGSGDLKQDPHYEVSVQSESVLTGISGDGDVKQDPYDTDIQKYSVINGSPNKEQSNIDESHVESVQENSALNRKSEGKFHRDSVYGSLAAKGSIFGGFGLTKELKKDPPCEVLSDEILAKKDSSFFGLETNKEPEKDPACEISSQEDESPTNMEFKEGPGLQAALQKEIKATGVEYVTPSNGVVKDTRVLGNVDQDDLTATEDVKDPEITGKDKLTAAKNTKEFDIVDDFKAAKHEKSSSIDDVEEEKPVKAFVGLDLAKEYKDLKTELSADKHIELSSVDDLDEPKPSKNFFGSDLTKEREDLKLKLIIADSKLKEAGMTIAKMIEERSTTTQEKDMLMHELDVLRRKNIARKVQVGFPLLYVCMVALVSLALGYLCHP